MRTVEKQTKEWNEVKCISQRHGGRESEWEEDQSIDRKRGSAYLVKRLGQVAVFVHHLFDLNAGSPLEDDIALLW